MKTLVITIFEDSLENGLNEGYVYPEWQFIQYLLPTFLAMATNTLDLVPTSPCTILQKNVGLISQIVNYFEVYLRKEKSRSKIGLMEPMRNAKRKLKNLRSLLDQVQNEFYMLLDVSGQENVITKQFSAFFDSFRWSVDVDLLKDFESDGLTNIYLKHAETENSFTRLLTSLRLVREVKKESVKETYLTGCIQSYTVAEILLRKLLMSKSVDMECADILQLFTLLEGKLRITLGQCKKFGRTEPNIDWKLALEVKRLTYPQLLWVVLYNIVTCLVGLASKKRNIPLISGSPLCSDGVQNLFKFCAEGNWPALMSTVARHVDAGQQNHPAVVHISTARKFPRVFKAILKQVKNLSTVKMFNLAQVSRLVWTPIMYCANCSKYECDLKICKHCKGDFKGFVLTCWFCSKKCENAYLEAGHAEEHEDELVGRI
jgi:hypothetical protein